MKTSYAKRILITAALVLVGLATALTPAVPAIAHHQVETVAGSGSGTDDTPWG